MILATYGSSEVNQNLREPNFGVSWLELYRYYASYTVILRHSVQCSMIVGATIDALSDGSRRNFQWCIRECTRSASRKSTRMCLNGK